MFSKNRSTKKYFTLIALALAAMLLQTGCTKKQRRRVITTPQKGMKEVGWFRRPHFKDDFDKTPLLQAIEKNYEYLGKLPGDRLVSYGNKKYSIDQIIESFQLFETILNYAKNESELNSLIVEYFDIFEATGNDLKGNVLFTGYYEPILNGSLKRNSRYRYPIYSLPEDLIKIDLGKFNPSLVGKNIVARIGEKEISPYYTREEIDKKKSLKKRGIEIAWLEDRLDLFFLHIQGSGIIETNSGEMLNVNYAASNGRRYKSIGRLLINNGDVPKEKMSMKAIREYLHENPEEMDRILNHNESYVFFRKVKEGPIGCIGVPLTPKRSIATDTKIFPKGTLAYIETEIPITDKNGSIEEWVDMSAFVIDQDTGGAIKGSGRVDIFFGSGKEAGHTAGSMNRNGKLFYLIKKNLDTK